MDISLQSNIVEWTKDLRVYERQHIPFATALALTWTAQDVKAEHVRLLPLVFDRPTRFTMNSLQVTPATKQRQSSTVYFKSNTRHHYGKHYLMPQVHSGERPHKRFETWLVKRGIMASDEFAVPARGLKLDAFGNISNGTITQILSQLQVGPDATQWQTARSKKRAGSKRTVYFVPDANSGWKRGIFRRTGNRSIEPVLLFLKDVRYEARYAFFDISRQRAEGRMLNNFNDAMAQAIAKSNRPVMNWPVPTAELPGF